MYWKTVHRYRTQSSEKARALNFLRSTTQEPYRTAPQMPITPTGERRRGTDEGTENATVTREARLVQQWRGVE